VIDLHRIERSLTYALTSHLGHALKPISHLGKENTADLEAIETLAYLRKEIANVKTSG